MSGILSQVVVGSPSVRGMKNFGSANCCYSYPTSKNNDNGAPVSQSTTTRRRFLVATIAFSGATAGTIGPAALRFGSAWAQSGDPTTFDVLVRLARLLLPHEGLADEVYAAVLDDALAAAADDESHTAVATLLNDHQSVDFLAIDEDAQLEAMRAIENETSFADILGAVKTGMYNNPSVWTVINYEGPSYQNGGYLNRGAGNIDWLPGAD